MANNETIKKTIIVALSLCVVCSVVVSTAAVMLKPMQERNVAEDRKRNILMAAGMYEAGVEIDQQFEEISARVVDLRNGQYDNAMDAENFNEKEAADHNALVYLVGNPAAPDVVILPVEGQGLWGPMKGFLALEEDLNTVAGLGFYEHKETPGLGGEVDNPRWKGLWPGKQAFDRDGEVALEVIKGVAVRDGADFAYEVDGLSGATLTSRGVSNLVQFWIGSEGFGPFLANLKAGDA